MKISRDEFQQLLGEAFSVDPSEILLTADAEDFETWDSLNHLNAVVTLEERCGVSFSVDEIASMQSIAQIVACLREHGVDVDWPV